MAWHFDRGDYVTLVNDSALIVPASGAWTIAGWFRVSDNTSLADFPTLIQWGAASGERFFIYLVRNGYGGIGNDHIRAFAEDGDGFQLSPAIFSFNVSDHLNEWIAVCLTHIGNSDTNLMAYSPVTKSIYTPGVIRSFVTEISATGDLYFGIDPTLATNREFQGDLSNWAYFNEYFDTDRFAGFVRQGHRLRSKAASWQVPMLPNRYEEWVKNIAVTNNGTTSEESAPLFSQFSPMYGSSEAVPSSSSASSALSLTSSVSLNRTRQLSVESEILFTHSAGRVYEVSANSVLTFAPDELDDLVLQERRPASSILEFEQSVFAETGLFKSVSSAISFTQTATAQAPIHEFVHQVIPFTTSTRSIETHQRVTSTLTFAHVLNKIWSVSANNVLVFTDSGYRIHPVVDTLSFVQSVSATKELDHIIQEMDLTHAVALAGVWQRSVTQILGIGHTMTYYMPGSCVEKSYSPFIGESTVTSHPDPPATEEEFAEGLPDGSRFILAYPPLTDPTDIVELRAPNLDNRDRISSTRINRETRGGHLSVYADPDWPQMHTLVLTISGLDKTSVDELQTFLIDHLGQEISLTDWEGREWIGVITTPNEEAVRDSRVGYTVALEFEGVLVGSSTPGSAMEIEQVVSLQGDWKRTCVSELNLIDAVSFSVLSP